jgi:eukaryotic-like serine/threonine-protein kinase
MTEKETPVSSFEIPDGPTTLQLKSQSLKGRTTFAGAATFTVTNKSSQQLACRLKPAPQADAKAEWLDVQGEKERPFAASETQKITVNVTVPGDVSPSDYRFRLQAINVNDPGNDYAESAVATLTIPKAAPGASGKKINPWPFIAAAAVLLLIVGVAVWLLLPKNTPSVVVPDVSSGKNLTYQAASSQMSQAGLSVNPQATVGSLIGPFGVVVQQSLTAGAKAAKNTPVTLTVFERRVIRIPEPPILKQKIK